MSEQPFHIWVQCYMVTIDAVVGFPCRRGELLLGAVQSGRVQVISEEQAKALNEKASSYSEGVRKYINDSIAERWRIIEFQKAETDK